MEVGNVWVAELLKGEEDIAEEFLQLLLCVGRIWCVESHDLYKASCDVETDFLVFILEQFFASQCS